MKLFLLPLLVAAARVVSAHYTFGSFIINGTATAEWQYTRMTANHIDNGPLTSLTGSSLRCFEQDSSAAGNAGIATVTAGSTVGFKANNVMGHPGYFSAYMSPANPANSPNVATGKTWFKIWEWAPKWSTSTGLVFDSLNINQFTFTIPKNTPSGQYLLRGEQIALHLAGTAGGAQLYLACAQINVVGGGNGSPTPTTSFPGAYSATDPGILINIYYQDASFPGYKAPGPAVWKG